MSERRLASPKVGARGCSKENEQARLGEYTRASDLLENVAKHLKEEVREHGRERERTQCKDEGVRRWQLLSASTKGSKPMGLNIPSPPPTRANGVAPYPPRSLVQDCEACGTN